MHFFSLPIQFSPICSQSPIRVDVDATLLKRQLSRGVCYFFIAKNIVKIMIGFSHYITCNLLITNLKTKML